MTPRTLRALAAALCVALLGATAWAQGPTIAYDDEAAVLARIDEVMTTLEEVGSAIDRTAFHSGALAFDLAFEDADTITAWVRDRIAFEPYAGVLRGASGALRARAANAFDQALLLGLLLGDAGYEVRMPITALDETQARRLLALAATEAPPVPDIGDLDAIRAALSELADTIGDDEGRLLAALDTALDPEPLDTDRVTAELADIEAGIAGALGGADRLGDGSDAALLADVTDYAWVEYRLGSDDPWTVVHPTGFEPDEALEADEVVTGDVPERYVHRIRIEAWIESRSGDAEPTRQAVMSPWEAPVANVDHQVIEYANAPDQAGGSTPGEFDLAELARSAEVFTPYLRGELAPGAMIYDLDGRALTPDVAGNQATGVFRSVARNAESAIGALGQIGNDGPVGDAIALTGHGLDVTLIAPGGEATVHRRWILDRIGPENRAASVYDVSGEPEDRQAAARALLGRYRLMVSTGATTPAYLLDRTIQRLLETRGLLELMARNLGDDPSDLVLDPGVMPGPPDLDHLGAFDAFDRALAGLDAAPGFRPDPAVLILSETVTQDGEGFRRSVDIVANPRRVLTATDAGVTIDPLAALRRGAWETLVEREMLLGDGAELPPGGEVESLVAADLRGPYRLLEPGDAADPDDLGVDPGVASRIQAELDRGALVLLGTLPDGGEPAWWRVDPVSGATLGVTADGRGQTMTEYTIQLYDNAFTVMFAVKGISDCLDVQSGPAQACCLLKAHLSNVAGLGLGSMVGAAFGSGAGLVFGLSTGVAGVDWSDGMGLDCADFGAGY